MFRPEEKRPFEGHRLNFQSLESLWNWNYPAFSTVFTVVMCVLAGNTAKLDLLFTHISRGGWSPEEWDMATNDRNGGFFHACEIEVKLLCLRTLSATQLRPAVGAVAFVSGSLTYFANSC